LITTAESGPCQPGNPSPYCFYRAPKALGADLDDGK
jgi:hypothetical protein